MSDFDQFASAEQTQGQEDDPAADFLAREQDQMAELENDADGDGFGETTQATDSGENTVNPVLFGEEPAAETVDFNYGDPIDVEEFDTITMQESEGGNQDPYAAVYQVDRQRQEPEKIRLWREQQKEMLTKKDEESEVKKGEWREVAKKEIEDWYKHREDQFVKTKKNNREAEEDFVKERDESIPGHEWERICRLCEFNPKTARNAKDVSRMRSILLQLKQSPPAKA